MKKQLAIIGIVILILFVDICGCIGEDMKTTDMSVNEIKNNARNVSYDDLMRNTDNYKGTIVYFRGKIVQVQDNGDNDYDLRVATKAETYIGYYENIIWVNYRGTRYLENDIIDVWGYVKGLRAYTAVLGNEITLPELDSFHLELFKKAGS